MQDISLITGEDITRAQTSNISDPKCTCVLIHHSLLTHTHHTHSLPITQPQYVPDHGHHCKGPCVVGTPIKPHLQQRYISPSSPFLQRHIPLKKDSSATAPWLGHLHWWCSQWHVQTPPPSEAASGDHNQGRSGEEVGH